ncbi:MAG: hypothetical protein ACJAT7_001352 [Psychromonas sp.]|jgi:hypothetical protein
MCQYFNDNENTVAARGKIVALNHPILTCAAKHYDLGDQIVKTSLNIEGATCIRRVSYEKVGGYNPKIFGHEGQELGYRLTYASKDIIVYIPHAIFRHDLFKGIFAMKNKAKRIVIAESTDRAENEKIKNVIQKELMIEDGRDISRKIIGQVINRLFKILKMYYRINSRTKL